MAQESTAKSYLVNAKGAARALRKLQSCKIHRHFTGYLCLLYTATAESSEGPIKPDFKAFHQDFFAVADSPYDKPYVVPFSDKEGAKNPFFNENVAGSYAASSLRSVAPLRQVVSVKGESRATTYSLLRDHPTKALRHLLFGQRVPALSLAVFLYRDYQVNSSLEAADAYVELLQSEFGFSGKRGRSNFSLLFDVDHNTFDSEFADLR